MTIKTLLPHRAPDLPALGLRAVISTILRQKPITVAAMLAMTAAAPALAVGIGEAAPHVLKAPYAEVFESLNPHAVEPARRIVAWEGRDIDGDGDADIVNPTGQAPRDQDTYGSGAFGASRDGGSRHHAGVDYVANAGQAVVAPISGFVSKIGYPYGDDPSLRYVEIENPALHLSARVFYVEPQVVVGQAVRLGGPIGLAQTLQARYPGGITDHVHLEVADAAGRKIDAASLIQPRLG